jgi:predicted lipoprotein
MGTSTLTDAYIESLATNKKGFHAIEYILFASDGLAKITAESRRRDLLAAYALNLRNKTTRLALAWAADRDDLGGGRYVTTFTVPAPSSKYPSYKFAIDALVGETVYLIEHVANDKIGKPFGKSSGGTPMPALAESPYSDNSMVDAADTVRGMRDVYLGTKDGTAGSGVTALVRAQSAEIDDSARAAFTQAITDIQAIPKPFETAVTQNAATVETAYQSLKKLKRVVATEVVGILGVTLKFSDTDND